MQEKNRFTFLLQTKTRTYPLFHFKGISLTELEICHINCFIARLHVKMHHPIILTQHLDTSIDTLYSDLREEVDLQIIEDGFLDLLVDEISINMREARVEMTYHMDERFKIHDTFKDRVTIKDNVLYFKNHRDTLDYYALKYIIKHNFGFRPYGPDDSQPLIPKKLRQKPIPPRPDPDQGCVIS